MVSRLYLCKSLLYNVLNSAGMEQGPVNDRIRHKGGELHQIPSNDVQFSDRGAFKFKNQEAFKPTIHGSASE